MRYLKVKGFGELKNIPTGTFIHHVRAQENLPSCCSDETAEYAELGTTGGKGLLFREVKMLALK